MGNLFRQTTYMIRDNNSLYYGNYGLNKEANNMNVEKVIRVLGYIVYLALWSPIIVLCLTVMPLVWVMMHIRAGRSAKEGIKQYKDALMSSIRHDVEFIRTGKW